MAGGPIMPRMKSSVKDFVIPNQRWIRPGLDEPGLFRHQMPTKHLSLAARGDLTGLKALIKAHPDYLSKRANHNRTFLWEAVRRGRMPVVKWLVERGAEVEATGCYNNESMVQISPYCAAVYYKRPEAAAYLLAHGGPRLDIFRAAFIGEQARVEQLLTAEPGLLDAEDPSDNIYFVPVLGFAVAGGQAGVTEYLLKRGAQAAVYTAQLLHYAGQTGRLDLVELLVAHGVNVAGADAGLFVSVKDLAFVRYLLAHGLSVTRRSISGFSPLMFVARGDKRESPEKVRLLLEHGAPVNEVGPRGRTALHYAARAGHTEVIKVLLEFGARLDIEDEAW